MLHFYMEFADSDPAQYISDCSRGFTSIVFGSWPHSVSVSMIQSKSLYISSLLCEQKSFQEIA